MSIRPPSGPTWDGAVAALFGAPYWIEPARRAGVASGWQGCMSGFGLQLDSYDSVRGSAAVIYEHLASRSMPLTTDATQFWPDGALTLLRTWIEQGCRRDETEPVVREKLPRPSPPRPLRVRRNILDLGQGELDAYRERLDALGAGSLRSDAPWQQIGALHSDWCLHYQEAFLPWHRANLLWFEDLVGMPIPYWNFMSPDAAKDGSPAAGLVAPFRDRTYVAPSSGEERPNPLRFAVAFGARSAACLGQDPPPPPDLDCRYVQRFPWLYTSGDDDRHQRKQWLALLSQFQYQINWALTWNVFSSPEGVPGYPWANLPTFHPPQPDRLYPHRTDFDGLYEQPHDNLHGWAGWDMANNNYTAFDPFFWSLHSGIDRIFEQWLRAHPATQFSSNFPLRPFAGPRAERLDLTNPDAYVYTTLGDMAKDSRALGYDYAPPGEPHAQGRPLAPARPAHVRADMPAHLYILFPDTRCILETYTIDVFLNRDDPQPEHMLDGAADHYAGRLTRLGMGVEDDNARCVTAGVTRVLDATHTARHLGLTPESEVTVDLLVTHLPSGRSVTAATYRELPGFEPVVAWGSAMPAQHERSSRCC
jgi:tyrosinase